MAGQNGGGGNKNNNNNAIDQFFESTSNQRRRRNKPSTPSFSATTTTTTTTIIIPRFRTTPPPPVKYTQRITNFVPDSKSKTRSSTTTSRPFTHRQSGSSLSHKTGTGTGTRNTPDRLSTQLFKNENIDGSTGSENNQDLLGTDEDLPSQPQQNEAIPNDNHEKSELEVEPVAESEESSPTFKSASLFPTRKNNVKSVHSFNSGFTVSIAVLLTILINLKHLRYL